MAAWDGKWTRDLLVSFSLIFLSLFRWSTAPPTPSYIHTKLSVGKAEIIFFELNAPFPKRKNVTARGYVSRMHDGCKMKQCEAFLETGWPGVDDMITIFCDFRQFSAKKMAFFSKTNVMIKFLNTLALFWVKNVNFFAEFFGENIFKIITSVPH
jgi:hypothetical protein